jgi:hypothetical protein
MYAVETHMGISPAPELRVGHGQFIRSMLMEIYWPGTGIVKSHNNAFDWRIKTLVITDDKGWKQAVVAKNKVTLKKSAFTIYSKARASK